MRGYILCYILLISYIGTNSADRLFGRIADSAKKLREDIQKVFHNNDEGGIVFKDDDEDKPVYQQPTTKAAIVTLSTPVANDAGSKAVRGGEVEATTQSVTTATGSGQNNSTDGKNGRENLVGGCATGFKRTSDGRCKPDFG